MPNYFPGPTREEVQVWLDSSPDRAWAGFVLSVEAVTARLVRVLAVGRIQPVGKHQGAWQEPRRYVRQASNSIMIGFRFGNEQAR
jgi:hypothetical protein